MSTLYLTEPRGTLRLLTGALVVTRDGDAGGSPPRREVLLTVPPHQIETVALVGDVHITADATQFCLREGIGVAWLSRTGKLLGRVVPESSRCADLRLAQYGAAMSAEGRLERARAVVAAKLRNAARVLVELFENYPETPVPGEADRALVDLADRVATANSLDVLRGLEGAGARRYFQALVEACRGDLGFSGREQYPPPDPLNAMLSLGYVLLGNRLAALLEARGLDPALGFFHEPRSGRPSLALDLLEEFRHPVVDRCVWRLANLRVFRAEHFEPDPERAGGMRFTPPALKRFFGEWEKCLARPLRDRDEAAPAATTSLLRRQVERLAADLRGTMPYRPLEFTGHA